MPHGRLDLRWRVVEALARLALRGRKPRIIAIDNGPEFNSKAWVSGRT